MRKVLILETKKYEVNKLISINVYERTICTDQHFINLMQNKRQKSLPNETGDIILGRLILKSKLEEIFKYCR